VVGGWWLVVSGWWSVVSDFTTSLLHYFAIFFVKLTFSELPGIICREMLNFVPTNHRYAFPVS
jgi:hypothetical protein